MGHVQKMIVVACSAPTITLLPGPSTLSMPLQFRRSQGFYIVSLINLNCNSSLSLSIQWTIKNCIPSCVNSMEVDPPLIRTASELYIPARVLPYGLYELQIMVNTSQLISMSFAYVEITRSRISPNLIRYGTSKITRGSQQDLQFNPGSYSIDPDQETFNASVGSPFGSKILFIIALHVELEIQLLLSNVRTIDVS